MQLFFDSLRPVHGEPRVALDVELVAPREGEELLKEVKEGEDEAYGSSRELA